MFKDNLVLMETSLITGSAVYGITNIYNVIGVIILVLDLVLIGFKIFQAIRDAKNKGTPIDIESQIVQAKDILEDIQDKLPKDVDNGGKRTE